MPAPVYIQVNNNYRIEYISGEVETLINIIQDLRTQLSTLELQKVNITNELKSKQLELLALYVQQTGNLPNP